MIAIYKNRWSLVECDIKNGELVVMDALFKKERVFHVPHLLNAVVVENFAYVSTSTSKIMRIDLNNARRQFVPASHLDPAQCQALFQSPAYINR